ncbi:hypothetical protein ILUMI_24488 [Ignelater luminosus]|uniref:Uncharacterized protein n=1 Tax=Ignelater luminosus TaxID=2038154 RepID=A0A8K0G0U8_IGNLU|nr:hypothetical protein ILUMI_24488 [Ignelater luminosus]
MLERFYNLKNCIDKALINIGSDMKFSDEEWHFRFILDKLQKQDTVLSNQLSKSLRERIQERRTELTGNTKKYDQETKNTDHTLFVPKKAAIRQEIIRILERVIGVGDNEYESQVFEKTPEAGTSATATGPALTLKEELEKQLKKKPDNKQKDYEKILKKEMACFESDGIKDNT